MVRFDRDRVLAGDEETRRRRALALDLAEAALAAVDPYRTTVDAIRRLRAQGERLDGATLFAFGKASVAMARAASESVALRGGIVIALAPSALPGLEVRVGAHPDPAPDAAETGAEVQRRAQALGPADVALALVSGGGSAMLELPREGVSVAEIASVSRRLMHAGVAIAELNAVRRALSQLKGGGLARAIAPARALSVILSDVPGEGPELVASGPTVAPPRSAPEPRAVLARYGLLASLSKAARAALEAPAERTPISARVELAADNACAREAALERARELGLAIRAREGVLSGEARELGAALAREERAGAWIGGGETTVRVRGSGRGGRNQELVLGALAAGWSEGLLLAFGTDGVDGSSDAAGALVDPWAVAEARRLGLDPERALADNDAHGFFDALGTALRCGPTGTNVADLCIYLP